jgi:hypothetical protein
MSELAHGDDTYTDSCEPNGTDWDNDCTLSDNNWSVAAVL